MRWSDEIYDVSSFHPVDVTLGILRCFEICYRINVYVLFWEEWDKFKAHKLYIYNSEKNFISCSPIGWLPKGVNIQDKLGSSIPRSRCMLNFSFFWVRHIKCLLCWFGSLFAAEKENVNKKKLLGMTLINRETNYPNLYRLVDIPNNEKR